MAGDGLLTKEGLSVTDCGLAEGSALSLELSSLPTDDIITLRLCVVVGNDIATKHNPARAGTRGKEVSVQVMTGDALGSVREKVLAMDEIRVYENSPHTRLRGTNWAGECGELLEELDSDTGGCITVGDAIDSGKLKPGDLLLIEEGRVPIKGILNIKV